MNKTRGLIHREAANLAYRALHTYAPLGFRCPFCGKIHKIDEPPVLTGQNEVSLLCETLADDITCIVNVTLEHCYPEDSDSNFTIELEYRKYDDYSELTNDPPSTIAPDDRRSEFYSLTTEDFIEIGWKIRETGKIFGFVLRRTRYVAIWLDHLANHSRGTIDIVTRDREKSLHLSDDDLWNSTLAPAAYEENALELSFDADIKPKTPQSQKERGNTMNTAGINLGNMYFGPNRDDNLSSTIMGIAVRKDGTWRVYDPDKKTITDLGEIQLGDFPIFIIPTMKLTEGDLIKNEDGSYSYVLKATSNTAEVLDVSSGQKHSIVPVKNLLGFSCYSKIMPIIDPKSLFDKDGDVDISKLLLATMFNSEGEGPSDKTSTDMLLPLMLMKDDNNFLSSENRDDKLLTMALLTSASSGSNNMLQTIMMMKLLDQPKKSD